jgi:hypothetical protein
VNILPELLAVGAAGAGVLVRWLSRRTERRMTAAVLDELKKAAIENRFVLLRDLRDSLADRPALGKVWFKIKAMQSGMLSCQVVRSSAQGITGLAVLLAGRKRSSLRDEWRSHLAGETGRGLPAGQKVRAALGFLVAAGRYRLQDAADIGWRVAEAVLKSRRYSNVVVFVPTGLAAIIIFLHNGVVGTLGVFGGIAAFGGSLYAMIRVGRWYRDVKPPEPKARVKE